VLHRVNTLIKEYEMADVINVADRFGTHTFHEDHIIPNAKPFTPREDESDLYFPVYERDISFAGKDDNYEIDSHKAIVRVMPDGAPRAIGIVGKKYKLVTMKELCHSAEGALLEAMSDEQLRGCQVTESMAYHGGMLFKQYVFPTISDDLGTSSKSSVAFRTIIINGYDGTSSFKFYNGAIDFFCFNGMVTGVFDMTIQRHTSGFKIPNMVDKIKSSIDIFYNQAETYKHWHGKEISDEDAKECFEAMPGVSERRTEQLLHQFHIECMHHGRTVWALYSAATFYATHSSGSFKVRETANDHIAATLNNRERQVRSWVETDQFQQIAA